MTIKYFKNALLFAGILLFSSSIFAQNESSIWSQTSLNTIDVNDTKFYKQIPQKSTLFNLDIDELSSVLIHSPKSESYNKASNVLVQFPNADGELETFRISEISIMEPSLAAKFPEIKTYVGVGVENPAAQLRLTITPQKGLSGMILSEKNPIFIEPYTNDLKTYITFVNSEGDINDAHFNCESGSGSVLKRAGISDTEYGALRSANDGLLRTYRLALAATVEYSQFHGGTLPEVMAALTTTMNRVNGIYVRDLGLTMTMVDNTSIIFLGEDPDSDPYSDGFGQTIISENQTTCDDNIGVDNYDIGHVFTVVTGFGAGVAQLESPCTPNKARAASAAPTPSGDLFDTYIVPHEFGHQFGAQHTQNNDCERSFISVEPGSGSTIMGYAGICVPNVQNQGDVYFHGQSLRDMWTFISSESGSACGNFESSGNNPPTASAGADFSIPPSTAFKLTGVGEDVDGDALTYAWEQIDSGVAPMPPVATSPGGPSFRSFDPKTVPVRYFPDFNTVISGSLASTWEVVPSISRDLNFLFTVRDNSAVAGNTQSDEMTVFLENVTPFVVSTPPSSEPGSTQDIIWVVGSTNNATINCQTVNILFSSDGGENFDTTLASGVPNNGVATVTLPSIPPNDNSRILVEAVDNVFYAVSDIFSLNSSPDFSVNNITGSQSGCGLDEASFEFSFNTSNGFSETATLTASISPAIPDANIAFSNTTLNTDETITMDVSNLIGTAAGDYTITVTATSPSIVKTASVTLSLTNEFCAAVPEITIPDVITGVFFNSINNADRVPNLVPYEDFRGISTDVEVGSTHDISVNVDTDGDFPYFIRVWIDWDQSCTFDPSEKYDLGEARFVANEPTSGSPAAITVPDDAVPGSTTMRVVFKGATMDNVIPCELDFFGQVEDYTVNVIALPPTSTAKVDESSLSGVSIFPNPANTILNINGLNDILESAEIYSITGQKIVTLTTDLESINVSTITNGVYFLKLNTLNATKTLKFVKM